MNSTVLLLLTCCVLLDAVFSSVTKLEGTNTHINQINGIPNDFKANTEPFQKIGAKLYYIEKLERVNWFTALIKCHQMGGNLVNLRSLDEIQGLGDKLKLNERYWVDLSNFSDGRFRSLITGELKGQYPLWNEGEPNNARQNEHCAHAHVNNRGVHLFDDSCSLEYPFICESKTPTTITIVSW
ncbi:C-type lectin 37Db-like [Drosophila innubila]|uniref:C-type lectin 37Db-like n=1 Tax=Drosophila innubila TaxID=198719 RepID=UPI00148C11BA|nr:C-type lectin 37Db-like [Drosophila innubila]